MNFSFSAGNPTDINKSIPLFGGPQSVFSSTKSSNSPSVKTNEQTNIFQSRGINVKEQRVDNDEEDEDEEEEGEEVGVVPLPDAPVAHGMMNEFSKRGRTLKFVMHPLLSEGTAWIDKKSGDAVVLPEETKIFPTSIPGTNRSVEYSSVILRYFLEF